MLTETRELAALRLLDRLSMSLNDVADPERALRHVVRDARDFFQAAYACVATFRPGQWDAEVLFAVPKEVPWDLRTLGHFAGPRQPLLPDDLAVAVLQRRGRRWGVIALARSAHPFDRRERRLLSRVAAMASAAVHRIDKERMFDVRARIDRKVMEQLDPKDLFYQILDGLRSLTQYDHSAALFIREDRGDALRLVAEQIAWTKARSERIGLRLPIDGDADARLRSEQVYGFDRHGATWHQWRGDLALAVARLLDYNDESGYSPDTQREGSMLCAPLLTADGFVGVLKIAARHPGSLARYEAGLVEQFRPQAAVAIQNLHRTETLRARVLVAERKHAMADLARSVSHDVNNALGSILPLVQQMHDDLRRGVVEPPVLVADLEQVQKSLQVCRRIFGGMLSFAREAARHSSLGHVRRAVDTASEILKHGLTRQRIELAIEVADDLPAVGCSQSNLEQVFLNLLSNAREATRPGGRIVISAACRDGGVLVSVADTGCGIAPQHLPRVVEPFFSTKENGNGLGLAICRSILWEADTALVIQSEPGEGTRVEFLLPLAAPL